jgi:hypothetical protein
MDGCGGTAWRPRVAMARLRSRRQPGVWNSSGPSEAGKQVQPISRSKPRSADTATIRTLERRVAELESLTTSQSRDLQIQFERIAQLQADCDILRIRFIKA